MIKKILILSCALTVLILMSSILVFAESDFPAGDIFSEEDLFSGDMFVEEIDVVSENAAEELDEQSLGISGNIRTVVSHINYNLEDIWFKMSELDENNIANESLSAQLAANILFDARFKNRIKGFLDLELYYDYNDNSSESETDYFIKELTVDIPYRNKIYIKAGKQVLKWGRSYFWNPTDLINIERKDISDMDKNREGAEGVKVHLPYGVEKNIYLFLDTRDINSAKDIAVSGKYEFLTGNTEMSFSAWTKKDFKPVYGYDISSRISDIDLRGEISLSKGDNYNIMYYDTLKVDKKDDKWISRISAGFTKFFDYGDISDRISVSGELYYNSNGYDKNIYKKIDSITNLQEKQTKKMEYLSKVYQANMNSKYYAAVFTNINEFIDQDVSLNINGIINLIDYSKTISAGVNYQALTDLSFDLNIMKFIGDKNTEATLFGNDYIISMGSNYRF